MPHLQHHQLIDSVASWGAAGSAPRIVGIAARINGGLKTAATNPTATSTAGSGLGATIAVGERSLAWGDRGGS